MRRAKVVGLSVSTRLTMPDITQAATMPEDMERSRIARFQRTRRVLIRIRIVQKPMSFIGRPAVKEAADLEVDAVQAMARTGKLNIHRTRYVHLSLATTLRWTQPT